LLEQEARDSSHHPGLVPADDGNRAQSHLGIATRIVEGRVKR
jgi:hypothetical protein